MRKDDIYNFINKASTWISFYFLTNAVWIIANILIIISIALVAISYNDIVKLFSYIVIYTLFPLVCFPSTAAIFKMMTSSFNDDISGKSIIKDFLHNFKLDYLRNFKRGIFFNTLGFIYFYLLVSFEGSSVILNTLFYAVGIILYLWLISYFFLENFFKFRFTKALKYSLLILISSPLLFITLSGVTIVTYYIIINRVHFLFLFAISVYIYTVCGVFNIYVNQKF